MEQKVKWFTTIEIVDVETGEIITKSQYDRLNYRTINKEKKSELKEQINRNGRRSKYGITTYRWLTKPNEQLRIF